jgi:hypothetical protein
MRFAGEFLYVFTSGLSHVISCDVLHVGVVPALHTTRGHSVFNLLPTGTSLLVIIAESFRLKVYDSFLGLTLLAGQIRYT